MASAAAPTFPPLPLAAARPRAVAVWLLAVAGLVFAMVVVGGITRLTESGLSITRWDVVSGTLPPIGEAAWAAQFEAYKASSQYQLMNRGMTMAEFQGIFFWEYVHRLLGRVIGLAFAVPLLWFWVKKAIPDGYKPRLLALLMLGALQGTIGWWMVSSGLVGRTEVAHERLAVHLGVALTIMAGCIWTALDLLRSGTPSGDRPHRWVVPFALLLAVQIIWGAFVAGMRAGHVSDSWPLMFGVLVPQGLVTTARDLIDSPATVHFLHRSLAWVVAASALLIAVRLWRAGAGARALALGGLVVAQFALGVATVLSGVAIPLGVAHQACGALLVAATIWAAHWSMQGTRR
ncbi:COX15/CtaA family protein [Polymorphobacter fuscus]|uniref:Heme A synthase n=1 Tax=Sandarakinorhabdus fusca TaxID=1439888 RepID=A0A7C9GQ42_9SPHN|nr:COX15/CtaA family protein [Polymorphobacter fuscus]KAB7646138.1 heme A synthase [Polymorphobacter fuscus]MQT17336.1 heme A synthase [Polymorphobacter fuscus]NJC10131.1 cytochrome c oxidase assembly protein subunit 15 [Polymorphobacter fuscus]